MYIEKSPWPFHWEEYRKYLRSTYYFVSRRWKSSLIYILHRQHQFFWEGNNAKVDIPRIVDVAYTSLHYCFDLEGRGLSNPFAGKICRIIWVHCKMIPLSTLNYFHVLLLLLHLQIRASCRCRICYLTSSECTRSTPAVESTSKPQSRGSHRKSRRKTFPNFWSSAATNFIRIFGKGWMYEERIEFF